MVDPADRQFPAALAAAVTLPFDWADGHGVDFEPFPAFLSAEDTTDWLRAWTGNAELAGDCFRVFGQDGTGGCAAFWLVRPHRPLVDQPVVFLGSEGETGVVARDLNAFLWLLAGGYGPWEAATSYDPDRTPRHNHKLTAVANDSPPAPNSRRPQWSNRQPRNSRSSTRPSRPSAADRTHRPVVPCSAPHEQDGRPPRTRTFVQTETTPTRGVPPRELSRLVGHLGAAATAVTKEVYRKQIRPVIQTGAVVMDGILGTQERRL